MHSYDRTLNEHQRLFTHMPREHVIDLLSVSSETLPTIRWLRSQCAELAGKTKGFAESFFMILHGPPFHSPPPSPRFTKAALLSQCSLEDLLTWGTGKAHPHALTRAWKFLDLFEGVRSQEESLTVRRYSRVIMKLEKTFLRNRCASRL